ncbi:MAG: maltokinase N-terminal cap-like domain-containing protein, partial [Solirubrobacteraceae bacterium]
MTDDKTTHPTAPGPSRLDPDQIAGWLQDQRWYGSKTRGVSGLEIEEDVEISAEPSLRVLLAQARFATGAHELYQLPISLLDAGQVGARPVIASGIDGRAAVDAVSDPELARMLLGA